MATSKRCVVFLWIAFAVTVSITSIAVALLVRFRDLKGHSFLLGSGDQVPLLSGILHAESFSRYFCQELDVRVAEGSGEGTVFSAYALPSAPVPSGDSYRQVIKQTTTVGSKGVSPPFAVHLHRGPSAVAWMKVHACSATTTLSLYRCPDWSTAQAWEQRGNSQGCEVLCQYSKCGAPRPHYCHFVAKSGEQVDEFVFALAALEGPPVDNKVNIDGEITRYPYDLQKHSAACLNTSRCNLAVDMTGTKAVVLEISPEVSANSILLQTNCKARISIYIAFFLGVSLAVILLASLLVFLPCYFLQKTLKKQSIELQVKAMGPRAGVPPLQHDEAGLVDNEHLSENY